MTTFVVVGGTGSYSIGPWIFRPGSTECDDDAVVAHLREHAPDWVTFESDDPEPDTESDTPTTDDPDADDPVPPDATPDPEPSTAVLTTDELLKKAAHEVQPGEHEGDQLASADTEPEPEPEPAGFPCSDCDRVFTTENGLNTHVRAKHA